MTDTTGSGRPEQDDTTNPTTAAPDIDATLGAEGKASAETGGTAVGPGTSGSTAAGSSSYSSSRDYGAAPGSTESRSTWDTTDRSGAQMVDQLQSMIDNVAHQAAPVLFQIAAKAAELAATAAEKAGPLAQKAAEKTTVYGARLSERGKEVASDLRQRSETAGAATGNGNGDRSSSTGGS
jgi:hypothetical protein